MRPHSGASSTCHSVNRATFRNHRIFLTIFREYFWLKSQYASNSRGVPPSKILVHAWSPLKRISRACLFAQGWRWSYTLLTHASAGHQRTESTNTGCNQWLSLAKIALKTPLAGRNRSLVANTIMFGEGINL